MTDSEPDNAERVKAACRAAGEQLIVKVRSLENLYWQASGLRPDMVVVLAGTSLAAALITAGQVRQGNLGDVRSFLTSWTFDRRTGELRHLGVHSRMFVVEDRELDTWGYRLMVPTDADMLGRPTVESGVIAVPAELIS